jgi:hypothetical protein
VEHALKETTVELRPDDDLMTRAERIVVVMGITGATDKFILSAYRVLKAYQQLDQRSRHERQPVAHSEFSNPESE